jgi:hypothetical protein
MTLFVAACALLLALLVDIVLDHSSVRKRRETRHDSSSFDAW